MSRSSFSSESPGILKLATNERSSQGGVRAISSLIHQSGLVLSQKAFTALPDILNAEYAARVPHPTSTTTAAMPAMSAFIKTVDSGLTITQKPSVDGLTAVETPGGGTCGPAGLLLGLIGYTNEPLELANREVGQHAITSRINTRLQSQPDVTRTHILRQLEEFGLAAAVEPLRRSGPLTYLREIAH